MRRSDEAACLFPVIFASQSPARESVVRAEVEVGFLCMLRESSQLVLVGRVVLGFVVSSSCLVVT